MDTLTFYDRCAALDWFWRFADDTSQPHIQSAQDEEYALRLLAGSDDNLLRIWNAWLAWYVAVLNGDPEAQRPSRYDAEQIPGQLSLV